MATIYIYTYIHTYIYIDVELVSWCWFRLFLYNRKACVCVHIYIYECTYVYVCSKLVFRLCAWLAMYSYIAVCMCVHVYVCICTCVYACIFCMLCVLRHIRTNIHTYTHTCIVLITHLRFASHVQCHHWGIHILASVFLVIFIAIYTYVCRLMFYLSYAIRIRSPKTLLDMLTYEHEPVWYIGVQRKTGEICIRIYAYIYVYIYVYIYMCIYIYVYIYMCIYIYMYMLPPSRIYRFCYIYIYIHIHAYVAQAHAYTFTATGKCCALFLKF